MAPSASTPAAKTQILQHAGTGPTARTPTKLTDPAIHSSRQFRSRAAKSRRTSPETPIDRHCRRRILPRGFLLRGFSDACLRAAPRAVTGRHPKTLNDSGPSALAPEQKGSTYGRPFFLKVLFVWHAGLAQTGKIRGFEPGADLRRPRTRSGQSGDARIAIVAAQPAGFGELGDGAFSLAVQSVGGSEPGADPHLRRGSATRLFQQDNPLLVAPLQKIRSPDRLIPKADVRIIGTEPDRVVYGRDRLS